MNKKNSSSKVPWGITYFREMLYNSRRSIENGISTVKILSSAYPVITISTYGKVNPVISERDTKDIKDVYYLHM